MKTHIAAWIAAIFMGAAFVAMPTLDSQDQYLQTTASNSTGNKSRQKTSSPSVTTPISNSSTALPQNCT